MKLFLEKCLDQVNYFKHLSTALKHEILYKFKKVNYEKGGYLIRIGDTSKEMFVL